MPSLVAYIYLQKHGFIGGDDILGGINLVLQLSNN